MQPGLARNYKPSALKTSANEVFQKLILLAATSNCKKNCQCTSIREPSKSRAQLRLIANWHEIFIITKRSTFNWNFKKKGLVKPVLPNFDFKLCHFGNNYDIKCRNSNQLFSGLNKIYRKVLYVVNILNGNSQVARYCEITLYINYIYFDEH